MYLTNGQDSKSWNLNSEYILSAEGCPFTSWQSILPCQHVCCGSSLHNDTCPAREKSWGFSAVAGNFARTQCLNAHPVRVFINSCMILNAFCDFQFTCETALYTNFTFNIRTLFQKPGVSHWVYRYFISVRQHCSI